jgi:hypothetical protein
LRCFGVVRGSFAQPEATRWTVRGQPSPATNARATSSESLECKILSGNTVGEMVVFSGRTRSDFGGSELAQRGSRTSLILSRTALELRDGSHVARYAKYMLDQEEQDKLVPPLPVAALTKRWYDADARCRGGSGDSPATDAACDERERYTTRLHALGQCYGKHDQFGPDMKWHLCGPDSLH